jgi:hypothetical protein
MSDEHTHNPEPESSSLAGYAAIKYSAIVIIVLAILAFIAWYVIPRFDWATSGRLVNTEPFDGDDAVDRGRTFFQELAWSVGLIGGVIAVLVLVAHFAA